MFTPPPDSVIGQIIAAVAALTTTEPKKETELKQLNPEVTNCQIVDKTWPIDAESFRLGLTVSGTCIRRSRGAAETTNLIVINERICACQDYVCDYNLAGRERRGL